MEQLGSYTTNEGHRIMYDGNRLYPACDDVRGDVDITMLNERVAALVKNKTWGHLARINGTISVLLATTSTSLCL